MPPRTAASQVVSGVATDANGDGVASVDQPADAIAGAAKYLLAHGVQNNVSGAIFAYNHLQSYVQTVLFWAGTDSRVGYTESNTTTVSAPECLTSAQMYRGAERGGLPRSGTPGNSWASLTCGVVPAPTRSTVPG